MPRQLYLDTARLGLMSPRARRASIDFFRFASDFGGCMYLTDFLQDGFNALPAALQSRYGHLLDWQGIGLFKRRLRILGQAQIDSDVVVAARSASLMSIAARLMFGPCRNILTTDLTWKPYERILTQARKTASRRVTHIALRRQLYRCQPTSVEIADHLARTYREQKCDGLFLPVIDCFGVHLPIKKIVDQIRSENELRFVVLDGAQAIHHVPLMLASGYCDFLLAGCHKWMQSFTPLGVGYFSRKRTATYIRGSISRWEAKGQILDPLLRFSEELETGRHTRFGESVAVSAMVSANAAAEDAVGSQITHEMINTNRRILQSAINDSKYWQSLSAGPDFESRILVTAPRKDRDRGTGSAVIRRRLLDAGVAASAYRGAYVRLSVPASQLTPDDGKTLLAALHRSIGR